jgi:DNA-binding CsgD family transcriptional regulator
VNAAEELDKVADLCARLDLGVAESDVASRVLEPIAGLVGAETGCLRRFGIANGVPVPPSIVDIGVPTSVREAYLDRYFLLDPVRRLLARRFAQPVFDDPARRGEWSAADAAPAPATRTANCEEFRRYRKEFLLPNHFYHYLGFCVRDSTGRIVAIDFHRPGRSSQFGALERARARVVAACLYAKADARMPVLSPAIGTPPDLPLTSREAEVADAVAAGYSNKEVAENLGISVRTVENHLRSIFAKCNVTTRTRLAAKLHEPTASRA